MVTRIGGPNPNMYPDDDPDAWNRAVVEMCVPMLEILPEHLRIDAASAVYMESRTGSSMDIPWATIFDDEDPQWVSDQLLNTALVPYGQTPSHNLDLLGVVGIISHTLRGSGLEGGVETTAAGLLVQIASGKPEIPFKIYADEARYMPMKYSWSDILVKQFGEEGRHNILAANTKLENIIRQTEALTAMYYSDSELDYQRSPDDIGGLVHGFSPIDERYPAYLSAAHDIRGLPYRDQS